jgi:ATP-dependent protease HslVU (ClpYQ) peptidase subunit
VTCIVGLVDGGKVVMGADSAAVGGLDISNRKDVKVFKNGDFVIGCTTSFRMIQLLQYKMNAPRRHPDVDVMRFMVTDFVEAVRTLFREGGFTTKQLEVESGGTFLVGYAGRLFRIDSDFQVGERADGFDACGCGESYALGAMACTPNEPPKDRLRIALETAAHFSAGVRGPFVFEEK